MDSLILSYLQDLFGPLIDPQKRIFVGYIASAIVVALLVNFLFFKINFKQTLKTFFAKHVWWSASARADYMVIALNRIFMMGIAPRLISKMVVATFLFEMLHSLFQGRPQLWTETPDWVIAASFTLCLFLLDDFARYFVHRLLHTVPFLWPFHKVHHTAETLSPLTVLRTHPVEGVIFALRAILVQAIVIAGFFFFFGDRMDLITVFGANVIVFIFNVTGANLRHSPIWISYGKLAEHVFISPAQHQIHHSIEQRHYDQNFGAVLAIWDWMGGSLHLASGEKNIKFGVAGVESDCHSLVNIYLTPFQEALRSIPVRRNQKMQKTGKKTGFALKSIAALGAAVGSLFVADLAHAQQLNIYSHRQPFLINPFIDAYREKTGTEVNVVFAAKGLAQRLEAEGERSPADVILTVDIARLAVYADKNLLATVESDVLNENIPAYMRDKSNRWFAFSKRARVIAASKEVPETAEIKTYEDLADPKWKGRVCSRPGSHVYNRALIASMIEHKGEEAAQSWAQGVFDNLARRPQGNDRAQVKAIFEGICDVAIINNYYYGKLLTSDKPIQRDWANSVNLIFPNQNDRGTHVNISGGGIAKYAPNKEEAVKFLEFLTSQKAQDLYAEINFEYPVNPKVSVAAAVKDQSDFKQDTMPIERIPELAPDAQRIIDRVGW